MARRALRFVGAIFLFDESAADFNVGVALPLVVGGAATSAGLLAFVLGFVVRARKRPVVSGAEEMIGSLGTVDPIIALWGPFAIFAALTFWMYYTVAYVPGGQPIGALEKALSKAWGAVKRRLPGRRRKKLEVPA